MGTGFIMINGIWIAVIFFLGSEANEVCYEDIGCFSTKPPWSGIPGRQLLGLPQSPEKMNISFSLFTTDSGNTSQKISPKNISTIKTSYFSPLKKTAFIIHGYTSTGKHGWVVEMCLLLVHVEKINCIAVDWEEGAKSTYFVAASNIRVLGAMIAYLIKNLMKIYKYRPSNVHLIGHSLGAHTAGETGRRVRGIGKKSPGIGRISGLDPAAFCFEDMPIMVRLDPSDAIFVDVIHSNAGESLSMGFGMFNATGNIDFYPNGGTTMPGCDDLTRPRTEDEVETYPQEVPRGIGSCHHSRSHQYFRYSILCPDGFIGYPCESYESFKKGKCFPCPKEGCPMMGYYADQFYDKLKEDNPKFFLNTGPLVPFCSWRYNISLKLSGTTTGDINILFHGKGYREEHPIANGCLQHGQIYSKFIDTEINPAHVTRVEFLWYKRFFTLFWTKLGAERVTLTRGQDGHVSHLCGYGRVKSGVPQTLTPC